MLALVRVVIDPLETGAVQCLTKAMVEDLSHSGAVQTLVCSEIREVLGGGMENASNPIITGRDARTFLEKMNAGVMTPERLQYLQEAAEASKKAELRGGEAWKARKSSPAIS